MSNTKYKYQFIDITTPSRSNMERNEAELRKMPPTDRRAFLAKLKFWRWVINCGVVIFITLMVMSGSTSDAVVELYPNTKLGLYDAAERILLAQEATDRLPSGYRIDESRTNEEILCIKAWDGSWMTWSRDTPHAMLEEEYGSGYLFYVFFTLVLLLPGLVLGTIITHLVPRKYSLLWRVIEFE